MRKSFPRLKGRSEFRFAAQYVASAGVTATSGPVPGRLGSMRAAGFDPLELTADASINQVIIGDFGCPDVAGMRAGQACSAQALLEVAAGYGLAGLRPDKLSDGIAAAAASADSAAARAAAATLADYGHRLGALIATLRDPRTPDEQASTAARQAYLSNWLAVDSVWLAGGLLAGGCGPVILAAAQQSAALACRVALTPYPAIAPLLGAALRAPVFGAKEVIAVADLGHTSIKTAVAERHESAVTKFWHAGSSFAPRAGHAGQVEDTVADALASAVTRAARGPARRVRVIISVASYLRAGIPADDGRGIYGCLASRVTPLTTRLGARCGKQVSLEFVHDGTAAAATAGLANSATITAGTALGSGFRPVHATPLDLAPDAVEPRLGRRSKRSV